MRQNPVLTLVSLTEKILNGKLHFLCSDYLSLFAKWHFEILIHKWMKVVRHNFCDGRIILIQWTL